MVLAACTLPALGLWLWDQRPAWSQPDRVMASEVANDQPNEEHEHTNKLIDETSPYLLQHAHNPVDWHPWGEEAFAKARREDKPIFLSVGYSTCYWCHVMEKESFEDPEVAAILNEHYIAIKVDREERPDVDEQYMLATQLITRRGGWPNSVWLTPEGKPWMAGTYFPKQAFMQSLNQLAEVWRTRRDEVKQQADQMAQAIQRVGSQGMVQGANADAELAPATVQTAADQLTQTFDARYGGFGGAPKFPPHGTLGLLIHQDQQADEPQYQTQIVKTLDAMWLGGMHDHIGGGFHRYATDAHWLLPHFEKMLYDNAQLMRNYTRGYELTGHARYRDAVADIYAWVRREMTAPDGGLYSALDSGEVGKEGEYYVWHIDEIREVLGEPDSGLFIDLYNIEKHGNFHEEATGEKPGTNIPHLDRPLREAAEARGEDPEAFVQRVGAMRDKLLTRRQTWAPPHKDDKVLAGWNGLMVGALAHAGRVLDQPAYVDAAERAAAFIFDHMMKDGRLMRTYRAGQAKQPAYLDDYAYLAEGLVQLYHATGNHRWLARAQDLTQVMLAEFEDEEEGGFFFTSERHDDLLMRSKGITGGGNVPNANGVAAQALIELSTLTGNNTYRDAARRTLESLSGSMAQSPFASESLLVATSELIHADPLAEQADAPEQTVAGNTQDDPDAEKPALTQPGSPVAIRVFAPQGPIKPGKKIDLRVVLDIDKGFHLYGPNPDIDFLIPSTVKAQSTSDAVTVGQVDAPEPKRKQDPILKKELNTYDGTIEYTVPVTISSDASNGTQTLTIDVRTQACDATSCRPPKTRSLTLPLVIAADDQ